MSHGGVNTGNALERQVAANEVANREADDYRELQVAALEKLDPALRSRHTLLPGKGNIESVVGLNCSIATSSPCWRTVLLDARVGMGRLQGWVGSSTMYVSLEILAHSLFVLFPTSNPLMLRKLLNQLLQ